MSSLSIFDVNMAVEIIIFDVCSILQVLQRKAKETSMAMERLKYLLESRKTLACKTAG